MLSVLCSLLYSADPWSTLSDAAIEKEPLASQKILEALLLEHPSFYPAHYNLGILLMQEDRDRAATHFEHATASPAPELVHDAWYNLALVRWKQGRLEDALAAAGKAVERDPQSQDTLKLRDELRRVALYRANEARKKAEAEAKKLRLPQVDLPQAHVGEVYETRLPAAGGAGGYRFALGVPPPAPTSTPLKGGATPAPAPAKPPPPPTLPPGLVLDADGRLHGTPTKDGRFPLSLVLTDQAQASVSGTLMLMIQPAPAITTTTLPEAILGAPYEAVIDSVGMDRPSWQVDGLPPGLIASSEPGPQLRISGTPTTATTTTLTVRADDGKRRASRGGSEPGAAPSLPLSVSDSFAPDLAVLPPATAWAPYTHQLGVRGKPQQYRWSSSGAGGLTLDAQGLVSGTPEQAGELALPLTIHAEDKRSRSSSVRVPVNPPPVIEEAQPLQFTVGQPAHRPLKVSGGTPPYTWQIAEGVLPKGLRLDSDGTVRGAPSELAETEVTVAVGDRWQARSQHQIRVTVVKQDDQQQQDEKDQQQDQQQQQAKQDQQKQDQQPGNDQQNQQQQSNDKQGNDQQGKDQQQAKQDQQKQDQPQQGNDQQQPGKDQQHGSDQQQAAERTAQQAKSLNQAAADRWLENLPKEDRNVLMYQLLDGGEAKPKPRNKDKPW